MSVEAERLTVAGIDPLLQPLIARSIDTELADLYREHAPRLIRVAASITLSLSLAEDVTQDAFVGLQRRFARS
jgi:DNA-directed RNA polymerase specialized sigma24 family protein